MSHGLSDFIHACWLIGACAAVFHLVLSKSGSETLALWAFYIALFSSVLVFQ
jgi:hypothetical protein